MKRIVLVAALTACLAGPALADSDHDFQESGSSHDFGYDGYAPRGHGGWRRDAYGYDAYRTEPYGYRTGDAYDRGGNRAYQDRARRGDFGEEVRSWFRRLDRRLREAQNRGRP